MPDSILKEIDDYDGNLSKVSRALGIDYFALKARTGDQKKSTQPTTPESGDVMSLVPENMRQYVVAARKWMDPWAEKDRPAIKKARKDYDAGTHELVQGRRKGWVIQYSIPVGSDREAWVFLQHGGVLVMSKILLSNGDLLDPFEESFKVPPISVFARSMSMMPRYTGHTIRPYSVAEHTVRLALSPEVQTAGLVRTAILHDFNEALTNDLPYPFRNRLPEFLAMEERVQKRIFDHFGEPWENMEALTEYDRRICVNEMQALMEFPKNVPDLEPLEIEIGVDDIPWRRVSVMLEALCMEHGVSQ